MSHTPAPWFAVEAESMKYCSVVEFEYGSGARGTVGLVGTDGATVGASNLDEQNANARLIAAAPEMLDALRNFTAGRDITYLAALEAARDAIEKATGVRP